MKLEGSIEQAKLKNDCFSVARFCSHGGAPFGALDSFHHCQELRPHSRKKITSVVL